MMDFNHGCSFACFLFVIVFGVSNSQYAAKPRPNYGGGRNVYKPVSYGGSGVQSHNSLHSLVGRGVGYNFNSRLPVYPGSGYGKKKFEAKFIPVQQGQKKIFVKGGKAIKNKSNTVVKSKTNINVKKEQPVTVVFNRQKPVIVLDRRPVVNIIKQVDRDNKNKNKINNLDLVGTIGQAIGPKTIDVNSGKQITGVSAGGANVGLKGANSAAGGASLVGGTMNVDIVNKVPAGFLSRPGMVEAAMAVSSGGPAMDVGLAGIGQNIGLDFPGLGGGIGGMNVGGMGYAGAPSMGFNAADALALTSAVARLEEKISGMQQQHVNINNNNHNNNVNSNAGFGGIDMDQMMMAMMLNGGELSDAMVESMNRKMLGLGGGGGGAGGAGGSGGGGGGGGSGGGGGGGGGGKQIKISPENTTGKSVILKVDGNVQISKSNIM